MKLEGNALVLCVAASCPQFLFSGNLIKALGKICKKPKHLLRRY